MEIRRHFDRQPNQSGETSTPNVSDLGSGLFSMLDSIDDAVHVSDRESHELLYVNRAFKRVWGEDTLGKQCHQVIHKTEDPCSFCTDDNIFGACFGETFDWEFHDSTSDRWYRCSVRDIQWIDGRIARFAILRDFSEYKFAEERLAEREKELACYHKISSNLHGGRIDAAAFRSLTEALPAGMQYPADTRARVVFDGETYAVDTFVPTQWLLESDILVSGENRGALQIYYVGAVSPEDTGLFLPEEQELVDTVACLLGEAIERDENQVIFEDLYEKAPDMYASVDVNSATVLRCNQTLLDKTGYSREEVVGKSVFDLYADESKEQAHGYCHTFASGGSIHNVELQLVTKDGSILDVNLNVSAVKDAGGKVVQSRSSWRDITSRKSLEHKLAVQEESFSQVIEMMPIGWAHHEVITDENGKAVDYVFLDANSAFERLTGIAVRYAVGRRATEVIAGISDAEPNLIELYGEVARTGEQKRFELFYPPMNRWYSITAFQRGQNQFVTMFEDITEQKAGEKALRDLNENLRRSNEELEQFAYVASHDLQEPLRMVASYTELLARRLEGQLDEKAIKYIGYAIDGASRMQLLINDLLAFSRVGTRVRSLEPTDCTLLVAEVLHDLEQQIEDNQAVVQVGDLPTVAADPIQLGQVFQNLISNALKFHGPEVPVVSVSSQKIGDTWEFSVSDNGIGINPDYHERIFVIFKRLHVRTEYPGTGIGLAIVKKIVERHGGSIRLESSPGNGSRFIFTLPEADAADQM